MQAPYWSQGPNRYSYVFNDPINGTDPSGFATIDDLVTLLGVHYPNEAPSGAFAGGVDSGAGTADSTAGAVNIGTAGLSDFGPGPGIVAGMSHLAVKAMEPDFSGSPEQGMHGRGNVQSTGNTTRGTGQGAGASGGGGKAVAAIPCGTPERCQQMQWDMVFMGPPGGVVFEGAEVGGRLLFNLLRRLIPRALEGPITITAKGLSHVLATHIIGGAEVTAGKSIFAAGTNIPELVKAAESVAPVAQAGRGTFVRVVDAGRVVGTTFEGVATSTYTVITNAANELITAFPGLPLP